MVEEEGKIEEKSEEKVETVVVPRSLERTIEGDSTSFLQRVTVK